MLFVLAFKSFLGTKKVELTNSFEKKAACFNSLSASRRLNLNIHSNLINLLAAAENAGSQNTAAVCAILSSRINSHEYVG
jgi:hypothetical protein